jgi:AraC-like DNA-binding protein
MSRAGPLVDVDAVLDEAFAIAEDLDTFSSDEHQHDKHQLLYAASGTMTLATEHQRWLLPPQRAAWIAAGTPHVVASSTGIELRTIYFAKPLVAKHRGCTVFGVTALAREMILHAMRWSPSRPPLKEDRTRTAFFRALAGLALEWMDDAGPYVLPRAKTEELARALRYIDDNVAEATVEGAAAAARVSVRTLSRRFEEETQTTFRSYLQAARMLRAMELLARPRASISATAYSVGFQSAAAFATAFQDRCGETPSEYRARVNGAGDSKRTPR